MADLAVWQRTIVDEEGNVVPGAEIEVRREEDGSLATLYADRAGETPLANPLAADMSGFVRFFAQGDAYTITAVGAGSTRTWRFDPTGRLQEFDRISEALGMADGADTLETRKQLGTFSSVAEVQSRHIPAVLESIRTNGYYDPGDGGGALYKRVASEPGHAGKIQSADGAWWEIAEQVLSVAAFGAKGDGSSDDSDAFSAAQAVMRQMGRDALVPPGSYNVNGTVYDITGPFVWRNNGFNTGVNLAHTARNASFLVTTETADTSPADGAETRVGINITAVANGSHHATGIRSNLRNHSDDGAGCTAVYANAASDAGAAWSAALHGETRHAGGTTMCLSVEAASYSEKGSFYGAVINNTTTGANPTHPITGEPKVAHPNATGLFVIGRNDIDPMGGWAVGLRFNQNSMRADGTTIRVDPPANIHFSVRPTAPAATADIFLNANSRTGIYLNGTYGTGNAISVTEGQGISMGGAGAIKTYYTSGIWGFFSGANERVGFNMFGVGSIRVEGETVLGARRTGWSRPTGTATRTPFHTSTVTVEELAERVKALIDDLHAATGHGLIGN